MCSGPNQLISWRPLCVSPFARFDFTQAKRQTNQNQQKATWELSPSLGGWKKKLAFFKDISCYSKWTTLIYCILSHKCSNHLGLISSKDPGAKWHLSKHFKSTSREHCVASRHAEKTCTALRAIEAGLLQQCAMHAVLGSDHSHTTGGLHWHLLVARRPPPRVAGGISVQLFWCRTCVQLLGSHRPKHIALMHTSLTALTETMPVLKHPKVSWEQVLHSLWTCGEVNSCTQNRHSWLHNA